MSLQPTSGAAHRPAPAPWFVAPDTARPSAPGDDRDLASVFPSTGSGSDPEDRARRIDRRRAFVRLKADFMQAAALVEGSMGAVLRRKVRQTHEPIDLWHLHQVLLALMPLDAQGAAASRLLERRIEAHFGPSLAGVPAGWAGVHGPQADPG